VSPRCRPQVQVDVWAAPVERAGADDHHRLWLDGTGQIRASKRLAHSYASRGGSDTVFPRLVRLRGASTQYRGHAYRQCCTDEAFVRLWRVASPVSNRSVPQASSPSVRRSMLANRPTDSAPELALARALHALGLRYRRHATVAVTPRPVRVDFVWLQPRVAVFVDGCFWHRCPRHATQPRRHGGWWREKLEANVARDKRQTAALRRGGWKVVRIWAHEDPNVSARRVLRLVRVARNDEARRKNGAKRR
jgi:DNA mismatch endonuclease (patch repair protein)